MKVILLQDVPKVGRRYDVTDVKDGYGLNFLIPQGLARIANDANMAALAAQKAEHEKERAQHEKAMGERLQELAEKKVTFTEKANEQGHLFAGIQREDVARELKAQLDIEVRPEAVDLEHALKEVGEHEISVTLADTEATVIVEIQAEE